MKSIKKELTVATCTLLTHNSAQALENAWELDSSYLFYSEENRVEVNKFVIKAGGDVADRDRINLTAVLDTMSGSTPTGAVKQSSPTYTGASGGGGGGGGDSVGALAKFDDTRAAMALNWTHSHNNNWEMNYGGAVSVENDYQSFSGSVTVSKETAAKDYKFTFGIAGTADTLFRVGNSDTPVPLSAIEDNLSYGKGEKNTTDIVAGVTHVINRRTVGQVNLYYSIAKGYMNDPYKVFSVVDQNSNKAYKSYYESRPNQRNRMALTLHLNHQTFPANNVINLSYRYYSDDWDVSSHTLSGGYRFKYSNRKYLEPKLRLYTQTAASFYQNQFFAEVEGNPDAPGIPNTFPEYISADYRLDALTSVTPEIQFGMEISSDDLLRARLGYMYQSFDASEFSTNKAIIFQIAYNKRF